MPLVTRPSARALVAVVSIATSIAPASAQTTVGSSSVRVESNEAYRQIVKKVDPILPPAAGTPALISLDDQRWPIEVGWRIGEGPISDADTVSLVRFVRAEAAKSRLPAWPIAALNDRGAMNIEVLLEEPRVGGGTQSVVVRKNGASWTVVK